MLWTFWRGKKVYRREWDDGHSDFIWENGKPLDPIDQDSLEAAKLVP